MPVAHGHPRVGARYMWTGQDGAVGPLLRMGLEPRRLASGAVLGVVIGLISLLPLASEEGPKAVGYVGVALMVVAYMLLQLEKLSSAAVSYLLLNVVGAILVMISLIFRFNLSAFLMEVFWLLIILYGLTKPLFSTRQSDTL